MADDDIRDISLRRLHELERQQAHYGPNTDPAVLIEIQELRAKYPDAPRNMGRQQGFDVPFLMNTITAILKRLQVVEERNAGADDKLDTVVSGLNELRGWVKAGGIVAIVALVLALIIAVKVF